VLATAKATYLWLPEHTRLWHHDTIYEALDIAKMGALFASAS
jgi:hypothetical protein